MHLAVSRQENINCNTKELSITERLQCKYNNVQLYARQSKFCKCVKNTYYLLYKY